MTPDEVRRSAVRFLLLVRDVLTPPSDLIVLKDSIKIRSHPKDLSNIDAKPTVEEQAATRDTPF
jgi:hypothetical protein